jgi:hypothetical protein
VWKSVGEILIPENAYSKNNTGPGTETTLSVSTPPSLKHLYLA